MRPRGYCDLCLFGCAFLLGTEGQLAEEQSLLQAGRSVGRLPGASVPHGLGLPLSMTLMYQSAASLPSRGPGLQLWGVVTASEDTCTYRARNCQTWVSHCWR